MANDEKKPLGRILLQQKLISQRDLDSALREQKTAPLEKTKPLASRLAERGVLSEVDALRALSEQHGVPGIDLTQVAVRLDHLDLIPRQVAEAHLVLPALVNDDRIFLAMASPGDKRVIDELEFATGKRVFPYVALSTTLERTIADAYSAKERGDTYYFGPNVPDATLEHLGVTRGELATEPHVSIPPERAREKPNSVAPGAPGVVIDKKVERAGIEAELETAELGELSSEISTVGLFPGEPSASAPVGVGPAAGTSGQLVLVIDDEEDIRKLLRRLLTGKGYRVIEADRGLLALRMVKDHTPDLIVLDAMLPELHGFDIARRIKGSGKYGKIPVIMISAVYRGWRIAEDLKANYGIEEYIEKPFRITDVLRAVTRLLAEREAHAVTHPEADAEEMSAEAEQALDRGIAAYRAGAIEEAIESLRHGVTIDPLAYRLRYHLALLLGKKGLIYEGISELERAVDLNPKHFPALKNLAVLYEKAGFKHKAVETWERALHGAPDSETRESIKKHVLELL
jgi:DNA-binding response OmpR family regulator